MKTFLAQKLSISRMGTVAERFERSTMPEPNSGCLLWLATVRRGGYGVIKDGAKYTTATHVALKLAGKEVPAGLYVLHRCDNPYCVNVDHLFVGTKKENTADAIAKGRHKGWKGICPSHVGEKNGRAILTEADVLEIRRLYSASKGVCRVKRGTIPKLAYLFGVSIISIGNVVSGRRWSHLAADGEPS